MQAPTMRERMLAVVLGHDMDRVPFVQYDGASDRNERIWERIGRENMSLLRWCGCHRLEHPNCQIASEPIVRSGEPGWRDTLTTPTGVLTQERVCVPGLGGVTGFAKHYVDTPDDYAVLAAYLRDTTVIEDVSSVVRALAELGDDGLPHVHLGRTPFQALWIEWVDMANLSMHLVDAPEAVAECLALLGDILHRITDVGCAAADKVEIPYVVIGDNITAPLIGEPRFRQYCLPHYQHVAARFGEKGVPLYVHMDGDLKPLWDAVGESGVSGLDSFSPPPDNDTRVADAVALWPEMRLLINFPSSMHLAQPEAIYAAARQLLEEGGNTGRLQIQVSENTPPGAWKRSYPEIVRAIADFGRPG